MYVEAYRRLMASIDPEERYLSDWDALLLCDAVVIFFGNASEGWLRTKLRDLQKIAGYGRTQPMLAQAIYTGPPETPAKQRYRTREALLLRNFSDFTPDAIQPFIDEINKAKR